MFVLGMALLGQDELDIENVKTWFCLE